MCSYEIDLKNLSQTKSPFHIKGIGFVVAFVLVLHTISKSSKSSYALCQSQRSGSRSYNVIHEGRARPGTCLWFAIDQRRHIQNVWGPGADDGGYDYDGAGMKIDVWGKDLDIISNYIDQVLVNAPLFAAAKELY